MSRTDERGAVTVFAVACLAVLLLIGSALGVVAAMVRAHRAAQSAADLGALAAASALARGRDPCGSAPTSSRPTAPTCCRVGSGVRKPWSPSRSRGPNGSARPPT